MGIDKAAAVAKALRISLDWLAFGQVRSLEELTPDETELLKEYRKLSGPGVRLNAISVMRQLTKIAQSMLDDGDAAGSSK